MALTSSPRLIVVVLAALLAGTALVSGSSASAAGYTCDGRPATIVGTERNDVLEGTPGNDVIVGLGGSDTIHGRGGNDVLCASWDSQEDVDDGGDSGDQDRLFGDAGNDRLVGTGSGTFSVRASGGPGDDSFENVPADYRDAPGPVSVDLGAGTATGWGNDTLVRVREVHGSGYGDTLLGGDPQVGANCCDLYGHGGNDVIKGGRGSDYLVGGPGADRIWTGPGSYDGVHPGRGADEVHGDPVTGGRVYYNAMARAVFVDLRRGIARGQGRDTLVDIDEVWGSPRADVLHGDAGRNEIFGFGGGDVIRSHGGDDFLRGGGGDDRLYGGGGHDVANGGGGADRCRAEIQRKC